VDVDAHIAQLEQLLAEARPVPLSASVMVNRREVEELLAGLRAALPEEMRQARWVLKERDELVAQGQREAEQVLADAEAEQRRIVSETEVVRASRREAERILEEARDEARRLRLEAEDYVDGKLANFEIALQKTLRTVEKGRERLRGRLATDELAEAVPPDEDDDTGEWGAAGSQFYDHEAGYSEQES
jgi:cell division septum initiation protein DivIVA